VPLSCEPKARLDGDTVTAGAVPVPPRLTDCGLFPALSVICTLAVRLPVAVGEKVTDIVQLALMARLAGQLLVWAKSPALVPPTAIPLIDSAAVPVLVNVTV
jgi:hypothetical protein